LLHAGIPGGRIPAQQRPGQDKAQTGPDRQRQAAGCRDRPRISNTVHESLQFFCTEGVRRRLLHRKKPVAKARPLGRVRKFTT
jgi:hypothetical protein